MLESRYDATIENPTASDSGTNSARAAPCMNSDGMNTASTQSIASSRGTAVIALPARTATAMFGAWAKWVWMFSTSTVASSTRMPTASARPPSVIRLTVCPLEPQRDHRRQQRQRDVQHDDQRAPPVAQEQQHHQPGQDRAEQPLRASARGWPG